MIRTIELDLSRGETLRQIAQGTTVTIRSAVACQVIKELNGPGWYVFRLYYNRGEDPLVARTGIVAEALEIAEAFAELCYDPHRWPEGPAIVFLKDLPEDERPTQFHHFGEGVYVVMPNSGIALKVHENICGQYVKPPTAK